MTISPWLTAVLQLPPNNSVNSASSGQPWTRAAANGGLKIALETSSTWGLSAGIAYFYDEITQQSTTVNVPAQTGLSAPTVLSSQNNSYVYLGESGALEIEAYAPKESVQGNRLCLGTVTSLDGGTTLSSVIPFLLDRSPTSRALTSGATQLQNPDGITLRPSSSSLLLTHDAGKLVSPGRNWFNDPVNPHTVQVSAATPDVFYVVSDGTVLDSAPQSTLAFNLYENGATTGDAIAARTGIAGQGAGISRFFMSARGTVLQLLPQIWYTDIATASDRLEGEIWTRPALLDGFYYIATMIHRFDVTQATMSDDRYVRLLAR